ncbi:hypothetical protein [Subtercola vilae]|uniref:ImmA/IrrE family metallo-endopeptidase n=1 Tax=Subtercola vilae TaxID=2056433 RepID=A0A4T2BW34_9MICO|nr:hypothetical protein [Subtercola vilae]TIH33798.1 hypothetical protein D4765_14035 [Subtercola vilae]
MRAEQAFVKHGLSRIRTAEDLQQLVTEISGKPVELKLISDTNMKTTTALWIEDQRRHRIILRKQDRPLYRARGLHHEYAHIILGHPTCIGHVADPLIRRERTFGDQTMSAAINADEAGDAAQWEGEAEYLAGLIARTLLHPIYLDDERLFG